MTLHKNDFSDNLSNINGCYPLFNKIPITIPQLYISTGYYK
jgi:hypothetical protein